MNCTYLQEIFPSTRYPFPWSHQQSPEKAKQHSLLGRYNFSLNVVPCNCPAIHLLTPAASGDLFLTAKEGSHAKQSVQPAAYAAISVSHDLSAGCQHHNIAEILHPPTRPLVGIRGHINYRRITKQIKTERRKRARGGSAVPAMARLILFAETKNG